MQIVETISALRERLEIWRTHGERIAFVPTMGNLHAGHLELVVRAQEMAPRVVVSIFVNPMQFDRSDDFGAYPRTLEEDHAKLEERRVDLLFCPNEGTIYPHGVATSTFVEVPRISEILCGASRHGHFRGVATVVTKLFNMVQPDVAVFGEKDYQQLLIIRRLVEDLDYAIEVEGVPIQREPDGLAMSSRNVYLTPQERARAPALFGVLRGLTESIRGGRRDFASLEDDGCERLRQAGFTPDYVSIRRARDLELPDAEDKFLVALGAAWLGKARLIDNVRLDL